MAEFTEVGVKAVVEGVNKFTKDLGKMSDASTKTATNIGESFDEAAKTFVDANGRLRDANGRFIKSLGNTTEKVGTYIDANGRLRDANGRFVKSAKDVTDSTKKTGDAFDDTTQDAKETKDALSGVKDVASNVAGGMSKLAQVITTGLGVALGNVLTGAFNLVTDAIGNAGRAVFDFTKESVNMAKGFQDQVAVLDIAGEVEGFESLKDVALAVGGDIRLAGISASGAAEGMTELFKAGLETEAIFGDLNAFMEEGAELGGALKASIDLAAASELELGEAASLSAVVLSTFGDAEASAAEQAEFVNFALNNMVKAADASVADVSDLAAALTNVGPTAAAAGLDLDEVNTALAILSTRGITGAEAGTALKSAIANMRRPTAQVQGELEKWGIELFDAEGNMFDFVEIIGQFEIALADATEEQKAQAIQTIAGTFGMNAMNALLGEGVQGWADMQDAMAGAADIQTQAEARTKTYSGVVEAMKGTIETLKIQVGDALLPVLSDLAVWFTGFADKIGPFVVDIFSKIGQSASDLFAFIKGINFGAIFQDLMELDISSLLEILSFAGLEIGIPEDFLNSFLDAFESVFNWLTIFIPQAISTVTSFWTNMLLPAIQQVWSFIINTLVPVFQTVWSWLSQLLVSAITIISAQWNQVLLPTLLKLWELWNSTLLPALTELWTWLQQVIPVAIQTLTDFWVNTLIPVLATVTAWINENLLPVFAMVVAWLIENIPVAIQALSTVWTETLLPALMTIWTAVSENIIPVFVEVWTWMQENLPSAIASLKEDWETVLLPALQTIWTFISETLIPIWVAVEVFLIETLGAAIEFSKNLWINVLIPALTEVWNFILNSIIPIFLEVVTWLQENIPLAIETAKTFWEETLLPALEVIWAFINDNLLPLWNELVDFFNVALTLALTALAGLWENILLPALTAVWEGIQESLQPTLENLKEFINIFLLPAFRAFKENGLDSWKDAIDKVKNKINEFKEKVVELKEKLKNLVLPDWLTPGSPPPLFFALKDINKQMSDLTSNQLPKMGIELGAISSGGNVIAGAATQAMAGPTMAAGNVMSTTVNINQSNNINSGMSQAAFQQSTLNTVNRAVSLGV